MMYYSLGLCAKTCVICYGKPKCVICLKTLSEESMKKNKLQRHLITYHPGCIDKLVELLERKLQSIASQKIVMTALTEANKSAVYASYIAAIKLRTQRNLMQLAKIY